MIIRKLSEQLLFIFFKNIEVTGLDHIPKNGPVIFVLNHPNGLLDPIFIYTLTKKRISFLAKSTLYTMPVVGYLIKSVDSIPVYRASDAKDQMHRNKEMFKNVQTILENGGAIGLFPEGTSHSDPKIRPLKSGAARIALGAKLDNLKIIPAHLYYTEKTRFRSGAFLKFGEPLNIPNTELDEQGEPSKNNVDQLTSQIHSALINVALQADHEHALKISSIAAKFFNESGNLKSEFELSKTISEKYSVLKDKYPKEIDTLEERLLNLIATLSQLKLTPESLIFAPTYTKSTLIISAIKNLFFISLGLPIAALGLIFHFWPYYLNDYLSLKYCKPEDTDLIATYKLVGGFVLFLCGYCIHALVIGLYLGFIMGVISLLLQPAFGIFALKYIENISDGLFKIRSLLFLTSKDILNKEIRNEIQSIKNKMEELSTLV